MKYHTFYFGQAYGSGQYGQGSYSCTTQQQQNGECTAVAAGSTDTSGGSGLANTGIAVAMIVTLACLIVFVSLVVRIWRRKPAMQEATIPVSDQTSDNSREQ